MSSLYHKVGSLLEVPIYILLCSYIEHLDNDWLSSDCVHKLKIGITLKCEQDIDCM